jgi:two-component system NtrC family response regulator
MGGKRLLVVDDDAQIRMVLTDRLEASGYEVLQAENGLKAIEQIESRPVDMVLLDVQMPGMDGMEVLSILEKQAPQLPVIILTAHGSIETAVEAMKRGAADYLPKPCRPDHIRLVVERVLAGRELQEEVTFLRQELDSQYYMVVGESPAMKEVMDLACKVAKSKTTVLIGGESGTGKQLLARAIHTMSDRSIGPFVQVNCTTLSEQLMESDMFGHERGAFTGAIKQKRGRFEIAHRGTIFLDEIGELTAPIQAKLLHVLEYGEFQRVGGTDTLTADVRVLAATNKDLREQVEKGNFRQDLFYRLNVMAITLPPLRNRMEDLPSLTGHFVAKHSKAMQKRIVEVSPEAMEALRGYSWPGNIRELENVIERAVVLASDGRLVPEVLPILSADRPADEPAVGIPLDYAMQQFKKQFIAKTLRSTQNNQTKAAEVLEIQRTYLNRLIKELGISV